MPTVYALENNRSSYKSIQTSTLSTDDGVEEETDFFATLYSPLLQVTTDIKSTSGTIGQ